MCPALPGSDECLGRRPVRTVTAARGERRFRSPSAERDPKVRNHSSNDHPLSFGRPRSTSKIICMRQAFQFGLARLEGDSVKLCTVVENLMADATRALLNGDLVLAERVIGADDLLNELRRAADGRALELLALQAPVAADLRTVVASLWNVADLHRMGRLAVHVAGAARRRHPAIVVPAALCPAVERMGELAVHLARATGVVIRDRDLKLAQQVEFEDLLMDSSQKAMCAAVLAPSWPFGVAAAVDVSLLSRFFERYADHAVNVARRLVFVVGGSE